MKYAIYVGYLLALFPFGVSLWLIFLPRRKKNVGELLRGIGKELLHGEFFLGLFAILFVLFLFFGGFVLLLAPTFLFHHETGEPTQLEHWSLIIYWVCYVYSVVFPVVWVISTIQDSTERSRYPEWRCPNCRKTFSKSDIMLTLQAIGGRKVQMGGNPKCPSCSAEVDLQKLLAGAYDA